MLTLAGIIVNDFIRLCLWHNVLLGFPPFRPKILLAIYKGGGATVPVGGRRRRFTGSGPALKTRGWKMLGTDRQRGRVM